MCKLNWYNFGSLGNFFFFPSTWNLLFLFFFLWAWYTCQSLGLNVSCFWDLYQNVSSMAFGCFFFSSVVFLRVVHGEKWELNLGVN